QPVPFYKVDNRPVPPPEAEQLQIEKGVFAPELVLHDFQVDIVNTALRERRGIINCATGGGKTLVFAAVLKALDGVIPGWVGLLVLSYGGDCAGSLLLRCFAIRSS